VVKIFSPGGSPCQHVASDKVAGIVMTQSHSLQHADITANLAAITGIASPLVSLTGR